MVGALLAGQLGLAGPVVIARVHDAETGKPIAGAVVTVKGSDIMAATDSAGVCLVMARVGRGTRLFASRPGYFEDTTTAGPVTRADTEFVDLVLHPDLPRLVQGIVVDRATLQPLSGASVSVGGAELSTHTSVDGDYSFPGFPYGQRTLAAEYEEYQRETLRVTARGGETTRVDFALADTANTGTLDGQVTEYGTGQPVSGAVISVQGAGRQGTTDPSGAYLIERLPVGMHDLVVSCEGFRRGVTRFRVVKGWSVTVNLRVHRVQPSGKER